MNNAPKPRLEDLPSRAQLFRSSILAGLSALAILVTVVLPAEYAIDPTGIGRVLGLTEMGEIKVQLAKEAEADRLMDAESAPDQSSSLSDAVFGLLVGSAQAQEAWRDDVTFTLEPGASAEVKLVMQAGDVASYAWAATGGRINFDLHAHGDGQSVDYDSGRGATAGEGEITAAFAGEHGWFWRNRDENTVTITLQLRGAYAEVVGTY
ncbi:MAG: transmembrane anchor protein [Roseovarius sp.]|uniref:transmembrane anchor protein n=1 Tax=Roseovarius sp. TaxID=1486281 RepID=UPI001B49D052|nr:transmembrane anchor protein [Roseovarius sp.]MBQ0752327.1 transmembrane anchor protein [Roseovarius sp.]MBQ0810342.1 transmembrane anchor protein [Roseovarius sp.]